MLDPWENEWFPIARAALERHFPKEGAWLFRNLHRTEGADVVISVSTFIGRLGKLGTEPGLEHGAAARQLLVERGLDDATVAQAQAALDRMGELEQAPPTPGASPAERKAAEQALWSWYLEWSAVARSAIEDPVLLRKLGFLGGHAAHDDAQGDGAGQ